MPSCRYCLGERTVKNGLNPKGKQTYLCRECGRRFVLEPERQPYSEAFKERALAALEERSSLRGVQRRFKVRRQTVAEWLRQKGLG